LFFTSVIHHGAARVGLRCFGFDQVPRVAHGPDARTRQSYLGL